MAYVTMNDLNTQMQPGSESVNATLARRVLALQLGNVGGLCDPPGTSTPDGSKDMVKLAATLGIGLLVGTFVLRRMFGWAY